MDVLITDTIKIESAKTKIIAHRGLSSIERENTNPAFVAAGNRSYFGIETDVHTTKDGKFVIIHDKTTDRITFNEHKINVEENDYSVIKNIVLPDLDGTTNRQDIRVPLLKEYIKICKKYEKICVLEVKSHFSEEVFMRMVDEVSAENYIANVIFISFDLGNCINFSRLLPGHSIQWITRNIPVDDVLIKILIENSLDIDIYYKELTRENIELFHSHGIKVNCWTCDDKADAERLVQLGVDFITSNILE